MKKGWILISGGSRGLGHGLAERYLGKGLNVATFARNATVETTKLASAHAGSYLFAECDATDAPAVEEFIQSAEARWGAPAALINNAAMGQDSMLSHSDPQKIEAILTTNLTATLQLTRAIVRRMIPARAGRIITVSSICGTHGFPGLSAYSASKGGVEAMTRSLARELGPAGILVNAIAPGFFESEMSAILSREQLDSIVRRTALGRLIREADLFPAFDYLMFDNTAMTGQVMTIDGGSVA